MSKICVQHAVTCASLLSMAHVCGVSLGNGCALLSGLVLAEAEAHCIHNSHTVPVTGIHRKHTYQRLPMVFSWILAV